MVDATVVIPTYNQKDLVEAALHSAINQDDVTLDIIVTDDASSDGTQDVIDDVLSRYKGGNSVRFQSNKQNLGIGKNIDRAIFSADTEFIILAAGDDVQCPWRAAYSLSAMKRDPSLQLFSMSLARFSGKPPEVTRPETGAARVATYSLNDFIRNPFIHVNAPSRTIRAAAYKSFGPLPEMSEVEDSPMLLRALMRGAVGESSCLGTLYRIHSNNAFAGGSKPSYKYSGISEAQLVDAKLAFERGWLSERELHAVQEIIKRRYSKWNSINQYKAADYSILSYIKNILFSKNISLRGKYNNLKKVRL